MSKYQIPEHVRLKAERCPHSSNCLVDNTCGDKNMCEVQRTIDGTLSFVNEAKAQGCVYRVSFGDAELCMCPIRAYIFDHYGE